MSLALRLLRGKLRRDSKSFLRSFFPRFHLKGVGICFVLFMLFFCPSLIMSAYTVVFPFVLVVFVLVVGWRAGGLGGTAGAPQ